MVNVGVTAAMGCRRLIDRALVAQPEGELAGADSSLEHH